MNYIEAVRTIALHYVEDSVQSVSHRADHIETVLSTARRIAQGRSDEGKRIFEERARFALDFLTELTNQHCNTTL